MPRYTRGPFDQIADHRCLLSRAPLSALSVRSLAEIKSS